MLSEAEKEETAQERGELPAGFPFFSFGEAVASYPLWRVSVQSAGQWPATNWVVICSKQGALPRGGLRRKVSEGSPTSIPTKED